MVNFFFSFIDFNLVVSILPFNHVDLDQFETSSSAKRTIAINNSQSVPKTLFLLLVKTG